MVMEFGQAAGKRGKRSSRRGFIAMTLLSSGMFSVSLCYWFASVRPPTQEQFSKTYNKLLHTLKDTQKWLLALWSFLYLLLSKDFFSCKVRDKECKGKERNKRRRCSWRMVLCCQQKHCFMDAVLQYCVYMCTDSYACLFFSSGCIWPYLSTGMN